MMEAPLNAYHLTGVIAHMMREIPARYPLTADRRPHVDIQTLQGAVGLIATIATSWYAAVKAPTARRWIAALRDRASLVAEYDARIARSQEAAEASITAASSWRIASDGFQAELKRQADEIRTMREQLSDTRAQVAHHATLLEQLGAKFRAALGHIRALTRFATSAYSRAKAAGVEVSDLQLPLPPDVLAAELAEGTPPSP